MLQSAKRIVAAAATASLIFGALAPAAFATTSVEISGNGSSTNNTATVTTTNSNTVTQSNNANVTNTVTSNSETGRNNANDNTGGSVRIDTGNSSSRVNLNTKTNLNVANTQACCAQDASVLISGNGSRSENEANLNSSNTNSTFQNNDARINNSVDVQGNTGNNNADRNTGNGGSVKVVTGHASSDVSVSNAANANVARTSPGTGAGSGKVSARIVGNGSSSDNDLDLSLRNSSLVEQDNRAWINNDVKSNLGTGHNNANDNTGADVTIDTGNASSNTTVDNKANFNWADLNCGCLLDVTAKIADNGSFSENDLSADLRNSQDVFQGGRENGNLADLRNRVNPEGKTGHNNANDNTAGGAASNDPDVIFTGHSRSEVNVSNSVNANVVGAAPSDLGVSFMFDLSALLHLLGH